MLGVGFYILCNKNFFVSHHSDLKIDKEYFKVAHNPLGSFQVYSMMNFNFFQI